MTLTLAILAVIGWALAVHAYYRVALMRRAVVMEILRAAPLPLYGRTIVALSRGAIQPGEIYIVLAGLEDDGLIESERIEVEGQPFARYVYSLPRLKITFDATKEED